MRHLFARFTTVAFATTLLVLMGAPAGTASAASGSQSDYAVASFSVESSGGVGGVLRSFDGFFCMPSQSAGEASPACLISGIPKLVFPGLTTSGTTLWADANTPGFAAIVQKLTNGLPDLMSFLVVSPDTGLSFGTGAGTERDFLGDQVGPSGVDLAGYTIDRIGLRADTLVLDSPGTDPNHDGIWTDFVFKGTFLFEGRIASADVCKNNGWRSLHGPGGSSFDNQGQCIRLVKTGGH